MISLWRIPHGTYVLGSAIPQPTKPPLNETLRALGERVRARRNELGWSQETAADECGIHWTHLGQVERGQRSARVENILKIAAGLQTTPGALLDGLPMAD